MLPFILLGAAVLAGGWGVKKGFDAHSDNKKAQELSDEAAETYDDAERALVRSRRRATATLEGLGRLKLEVWDRDLGRFTKLYGRLHPIELINRADTNSGRAPVTSADLGKMAELSGFAQQALASGGLALGAGALAGVAAYGGAVMFAAASTGTAISALAGTAAANATLAWFGGGALAAGGLGMAGGMAVLGGIIAGPVLAVGGALWASMAKENLAKARRNLAGAKRAAAEMRAASSLLDGIQCVAEQFHTAIVEVRSRFITVLDALERQIKTTGANYRRYTQKQRKLVHLVVQFAQTMKALLETPFLTKHGALRRDYTRSLKAARELVPELAP
jgi:hypothetical protein